MKILKEIKSVETEYIQKCCDCYTVFSYIEDEILSYNNDIKHIHIKCPHCKSELYPNGRIYIKYIE